MVDAIRRGKTVPVGERAPHIYSSPTGTPRRCLGTILASGSTPTLPHLSWAIALGGILAARRIGLAARRGAVIGRVVPQRRGGGSLDLSVLFVTGGWLVCMLSSRIGASPPAVGNETRWLGVAAWTAQSAS